MLKRKEDDRLRLKPFAIASTPPLPCHNLTTHVHKVKFRSEDYDLDVKRATVRPVPEGEVMIMLSPRCTVFAEEKSRETSRGASREASSEP